MDPPGAAAGPCGLLWGALCELPLGEAFRFEPGVPLQASWGPDGGHDARAARAGDQARPAAAGERCHLCSLPLGSCCYAHGTEGQLLHGECKAELVLQQARADEEARLERDARLKEKHRVEFGIGWKAEMIPGAARAAGVLGCPTVQQGMYCVVLAADSSVRLAPTADPTAAINPEYLSIALRVRREQGTEAFFSLDPQQGPLSVSDGRAVRWQAKRFEPPWLDGTSVGEVLFQADYHLKELSMGERDQPVLGMRSCLDLAGPEGGPEGWQAREWFVVRRAELQLAEGGALVPRVDMAVEAREMARGPGGALEDARLTRPEHPLVRYAADFTRHFDLIAERRGAVYQLRELAKASVLAKFLLESALDLDESWFCLAGPGSATQGPAMVPQLWNERSHSQVCVKDGEILEAGALSGTRMHGVYGGVQLSLQEWNVSKKTLQPLSIPSWFPKGVDLSLDTVDLSAPTGRSEGPCDKLPHGEAFWSSIDGSPEPRLQEEQKRLLRELFNPHLSDRRGEGDKFTPPDSSPAYLRKLGASLEEEEAVRRQRRSCFLGAGFDAERPGPLFPGSWTPASSFGPAARPGALRPRPDLEAQGLCLLWQGATPAFDRAAEDGARFRVYRAQGLELRTLQPRGGAERLAAVLSAEAPGAPGAPGAPAPPGAAPAEARLLGATEYVEAAPGGGARFYVALELEGGRAAAVEEGADGRAAWAWGPAGLAARNAAARALRSARCGGAGAGPALGELRGLAAALPPHSGSRACAEAVFGRVLAGRARAPEPAGPRGGAPAPAAARDGPDDYGDLNYAI